MIDAEEIYRKARNLDPPRLRALSEFLDFLLTKGGADSHDGVFAESAFEDPDAPSVYQGKPLTLEQMREVIDWEAGKAR
jgi:hypothetical protein